MKAAYFKSHQVVVVTNAGAKANFVTSYYAMWLIVCQDIIHMHRRERAVKMYAKQAWVRFVAQKTVTLDYFAVVKIVRSVHHHLASALE